MEARTAATSTDAPARYAVIDVGTNSVKLHVAERSSDGAWREIVDRAEMTRLGEGLAAHGEVGPRAVEQTASAIAAMADEARSSGAREIAAVGTAWLRMARNRDEVIETVEARSGVRIEPIAGPEEARLAYVATTAALGPIDGSVVVFDTGGGSSQFTFGHGARVEERVSATVGAVRYTERYGLANAVSRDELEDVLDVIATDLAVLDGRAPAAALIGMGGGVTNLTAVSLGMTEYDATRIQGAQLDRSEIERQVELYRSRDTPARRTIPGLQPGRADVILAGACIVLTIMDKLAAQSFTVSDRGLRHGLLDERFGAGASMAAIRPRTPGAGPEGRI